MTAVGWTDPRIRPGFHIGPLGGLIALPDLKGSLSHNSGLASEVRHNPLTGRARVVVREGGAREWSCSIPSAYPDEVANLRAVARGAAGIAPMWWLTPEATGQNLLTEDASHWLDGWEVIAPGPPAIPPNLTRGGNVLTDGGVALGSALFDYTGASWLYQSMVVPVADGIPFVASVCLRAASSQTAQIRIVWTDGSGADLGSGYVTAGTTNVLSPLVRVVAQGAPPPGAAGARIQIRRAVQAARPQFTWGSLPATWSAGEGCQSGWLHSLESEPLDAAGPGGLQRKAVSFTVTEVE